MTRSARVHVHSERYATIGGYLVRVYQHPSWEAAKAAVHALGFYGGGARLPGVTPPAGLHQAWVSGVTDVAAYRELVGATKSHRQDGECTVGPDGLCTDCNALHDEPCQDCGGRGYHRVGCVVPDSDDRHDLMVWETTGQEALAIARGEA